MIIQTKKLLGYEISTSSMDEIFRYVLERLQDGKNTHIVTINPEMIQSAAKNDEFSEILHNAEILIPDGIGIKIAFRLNGFNINRIAGIEFAYKLLEFVSENNLPVALIGAKNEILSATARNLKDKLAGLNILYQRDGYFSDEEKTQIIDHVKSLAPKVVLVALGAPRQEIFINELKEKCTGTVFIGVGGSFDVWSGYVKRAPVLFQKLGLEWLYRTLQQPGRFKRIFPTLPLFLFRVIMSCRVKK